MSVRNSGNVFWHVTHVNRNRRLSCVHRWWPAHPPLTWHMSPDQCNNTNHSPDDHHVPLMTPTHLTNVLNIIPPPDKGWQWPFSYSSDRQSTTHSPDKCNDHTAYSPDECCRWQPPRVGGCQGEPGDHPRPTPAQHTRDNPCSRGAGPGDRHRYWDNLWVK